MKKQRNLTLMAYQAVKEMILSHYSSAGKRLILADLATILKVSRTPIYNALCILAKEGYLDFVPNHGFTVRCFTMEEIEDLNEAKETLEISTIGKALNRMTVEGLRQLEKAKCAYEHGVAHHPRKHMFQLDTQFHAGIMSMVGNHYLVQRYLEICQMLSLRFRIDELGFQFLHGIAREHDELYEAISIRDIATARALIKRHHHSQGLLGLPSSAEARQIKNRCEIGTPAQKIATNDTPSQKTYFGSKSRRLRLSNRWHTPVCREFETRSQHRDRAKRLF